MSIDYRPVSRGDDYDAVRRLRYDVIAIEEGLRVDGMDPEKGTLGDALDERSLIVGAFDGAQAVATVRCTPIGALPGDSHLRSRFTPELFPVGPSQQVTIGRLVVRESHRGAAISVALLGMIHRHLVREDIELAFLECNPRLLPLYEQLGARLFRAGIADPQCGLMTPMVYVVGDVEHARRVGSPLASPGAAPNSAPAARLAAWFEATFGRGCGPASLRHLPARNLADVLASVVASRSPLFEQMDERDVGTILRNSAVVHLPAATPILPFGSAGTDMYLLLRGCVALRSRASATPPLLLYPGEFFGGERFACGEGPQPFGADAVAVGAVRLLSISTEWIRRLQKTHARLAGRFVAAVASRSATLDHDAKRAA